MRLVRESHIVRPSVARIGFIDEWHHLVFAKTVQEITFGFASWFSEKAIMFRSAFSEARFKPVRSIGNSMSDDGIQQLLVDLHAECWGLFAVHRNHWLEGFKRLDRSLEADRSRFDSVFGSSLSHDRS